MKPPILVHEHVWEPTTSGMLRCADWPRCYAIKTLAVVRECPECHRPMDVQS